MPPTPPRPMSLTAWPSAQTGVRGVSIAGRVGAPGVSWDMVGGSLLVGAGVVLIGPVSPRAGPRPGPADRDAQAVEPVAGECGVAALVAFEQRSGGEPEPRAIHHGLDADVGRLL